MAWILASLRRLRDERLSALGLAVLVLVTALLAAAAPRLVDRVADDTLQSTVGEAQPNARNIQLVREDRLEVANQPGLDTIELAADEAFDLLPPDLGALVGQRAWTAETGRFLAPEVVGDPATVRLRVQPDAAERLTLLEGRWPTAATRSEPNPEDPLLGDIAVFEVAMPDRTLAALGFEVGATLHLLSDSSDPLVGRGHDTTIGIDVVGTFRPVDEEDPWWIGDRNLARPSIRSPGGDLRITDATALLAPEAYDPYMADTRAVFLPVRYTFREYIDPARLDSSDVEARLVDLKRLEAAYPSTNVTFNQPIGMRTGLRALIDGYRARWGSAMAILTVGGIGPAAVAAGALGLVAVLAAQRRRSALALSRGRGASLPQVVAAVIAEGLVLTAPPAALAVAAALLLVPADPVLPSVVGGIAVAAAAIAMLVLATVPATAGPAFGAAREAFIPRRPTPRRLIFEGLIVVLALGGAYLLRERGVRGASSASTLGEADPLVAAVPALIGLAAGLVAVRLFPYPMRALAWLARRRRDLVPALAMRRATIGNGVAPVLIVLLATATIGAFSSAVLVHLDRAADAVGWREVGAAYRIDSTSGTIRSGFDPLSLPDVEVAARASSSIVNVGPRRFRVEFVALEANAYDQVVRGTPADPHLPVDLFAEHPDVIPLVVAQALLDRDDGLSIGDEFPVTVEAYTFQARVVAGRSDLPALASNPQWVLASRDQLKQQFENIPLVPQTIFLRAPAESAAAIRTAVQTQIPVGVTLADRAAATDALRTSPISRAVDAGITLAALVAIAYAVLAVAAALALAGAARAVEVAHLRTLGLTGRQAAGLVVAEHGPTVLVAFAAGVGLGLGMFVGLRQGLGLEALVGSRIDIPLVIDASQLGLVLGGILAVIVLGLLLGTLMQRSAAPVAALRRGFE